MALETVRLKLTGRRPLLMHNGRLADPTDPATRALKAYTGKGKTKTEADYLELKRLEWLGGLYTDESGFVCITEDMILSTGTAGAQKAKLGKQFKAGVLGESPYYPLEYSGSRDVVKLYESGTASDYRPAVVGRARVMRSRPRFNQWAVTVALHVDTSVIDRKAVVDAMTIAGELVGLGDFRPRFGRFAVEDRGPSK
jgi:hypothetical protein